MVYNAIMHQKNHGILDIMFQEMEETILTLTVLVTTIDALGHFETG